MRKKLETVINSIISEDTKSATNAFHDYLRVKTQSVLTESGEYEEEICCDDDEDDIDLDQMTDEEREQWYWDHPESIPDDAETTARYRDPNYVGH